MSKNSPSPVRVSNPASSNHIVPVHPNQDVVVTFEPQKEPITMTSDSGFLKIISESATYFKLGQVFDFSDWAESSKLYLGNISFNLGNDKPLVNLSVVLSNKPAESLKKITVVNPKGCQLKVDIDDYIEVVICEPTIDSLMCNVLGGENGLLYATDFRFELKEGADIYAFHRGEEILPFCLDTKELLSPVGTLPVFAGAKKEYRFWFKLTEESLEKSKGMESGAYNAGKIVFVVPKVGTVYQIDFLLDVRDKKRKKQKKAEKKKILLASSLSNNAQKKKNKNNKNKNKNHNQTHNRSKLPVVTYYQAEKYRAQKVAITQKIQPKLDGNNCHWEWHHEFSPTKKNNTNLAYRGFKEVPSGGWADELGFIHSTKTGEILGYHDNYDYLADEEYVGWRG